MIRTLLNIDGAACATTTGKAKKRATEAVLQRGEDPKAVRVCGNSTL
ncbi:hypothetical protein [Streptomyces sp. NBC_01334]|nr:hypothetical protein OG736_46475 [Streptomyces sp. NBC_01334]